MSYSADFSLSTNAGFAGRVQMSMINNALQIANVGLLHSSNPKKFDLAIAILNNPSAYVNLFVFAALEASGPTTLTNASTDAQIDAAVVLVWGQIAGVS
jgi:hypothetical protein